MPDDWQTLRVCRQRINNVTLPTMTITNAPPLHVFITAHPDDESMFFIPTILSLPNPKWIVCLSNGNYDGLGKDREMELHRACGMLGFDKIVCLNHPALPDGPTGFWSKYDIDRVLREQLPTDTPVIHLITFDEEGVSGHVNHRATCRGVQHFLHEQQKYGSDGQKCRFYGWKLETITNPFIKYLPIFHWLMLSWTWLVATQLRLTRQVPLSTQNLSAEFISYRPVLNWKCMAAHYTQFVWYRRLFVVFSSYTYFNRIKRMEQMYQLRPATENDPVIKKDF